ncbi:hypothetical protein BD289DRAFT_463983 [Coniella lustricola]|uniref:Uncharacterized protein n=1 Tax=Coniella lustricola TaxID=2025994 RepID=A0A2T2ZT12_9PEZI|nr:hypothetical protein BD289DRAFT_463983 [Coniella lustricola]
MTRLILLILLLLLLLLLLRGLAPKTTAGGAGLPPGKYDVFIIPEHSAGSGFLYLPSLRTNTNSFIAGFATAIIVVVFAQSMAPAFQAWWANFQGMGNAGMTLLMIAVGLGAWSLGRQTSDGAGAGAARGTSEGGYYPSGGPGSMPGGGSGFGNAGASPHGARPEPAANAGPPPSAHAAPGGGSQPNGHKPAGAYQRPPQPQPQAHSQPPPPPPQPQPQPQAHAPPPPPPQPHSAPPPQAQPPPPASEPPKPQAYAPPPQPSAAANANAKAKAQAEAHKNAWEKAREEVRRKEEERKAREAEEKRKSDVAARLKELREKEARERAQREAERARREAEAKEAKEKEAREARAKEIRERLVREREERRKKLEEERKRDEEKKREEEKKRKEAETSQSRASGSYAFAGVGEKLNPWPNGKPPTVVPPPPTPPAAAAGPPPRSPSPNKKPPAPTARSFASTEDDTHSYRTYDQPRQAGRRASNSDLSESSWAPSQSTARTTPPPSVRGPYATKDPDKIVIKAVYCFMNQFAKTPASQLISGVGSVTEGLILRITTEGLFIDDDLRGVAQREWDVKAWTLKLVEVWCPVHFLACAIAANSTPTCTNPKGTMPDKISTAFFAKQTGGNVRLRAAERANPKALTGDEADTYLGEMLSTCNCSCRLGDCASSFVDGSNDDASNVTSTSTATNATSSSSGSSTRTNNSAKQTGDWKARGLHLLRATVRDQDGKRYMFVVGEEEGWKVAMGLQKLRKGSQVRALGVAGIGGLETKNTLEMLGWG